MITELRKIIFADEDLKKAISALSEKQGNKLLKGPIKTITIEENEAISATLVVDTLVGGESETVTIEAPFLAAAMLRYCFESNIPIPKNSQKKIERADDSLAINITINVHES